MRICTRRECGGALSRSLRASQQPHLLLGVTHFSSSVSFLFLCRALRGHKIQRRRRKKNPVVYVHFMCCLRRTWTVLPAENSTSFSPVKPSVRPHHGEQALRIRDIISLSGKLVLSIFPTTLRHVEVLQHREEEETKLSERGASWKTWRVYVVDTKKTKMEKILQVFLGVKLATRWSCFQRKAGKNQVTESELFVLLANPRYRPSCTPPPRISGFYFITGCLEVL